MEFMWQLSWMFLLFNYGVYQWSDDYDTLLELTERMPRTSRHIHEDPVIATR